MTQQVGEWGRNPGERGVSGPGTGRGWVLKRAVSGRLRDWRARSALRARCTRMRVMAAGSVTTAKMRIGASHREPTPARCWGWCCARERGWCCSVSWLGDEGGSHRGVAGGV